MTTKPVSPPRCAVLIGPYTSGKTTLLEALLFTAGAIRRKGSVNEGNTVGDGSPVHRQSQIIWKSPYSRSVQRSPPPPSSTR